MVQLVIVHGIGKRELVVWNGSQDVRFKSRSYREDASALANFQLRRIDAHNGIGLDDFEDFTANRIDFLVLIDFVYPYAGALLNASSDF